MFGLKKSLTCEKVGELTAGAGRVGGPGRTRSPRAGPGVSAACPSCSCLVPEDVVRNRRGSGGQKLPRICPSRAPAAQWSTWFCRSLAQAGPLDFGED